MSLTDIRRGLRKFFRSVVAQFRKQALLDYDSDSIAESESNNPSSGRSKRSRSARSTVKKWLTKRRASSSIERPELTFSQQLRETAVRLLRLPITFPIFLVTHWASSRRGVAFLYGAPAVISAGVVMTAIVFIQFRQTQLNRSYAREASTALLEEDFDKAGVMFRKLVRLNPNAGQQYRFELVQAQMLAGKENEALPELRALAPEDRPGYPKAHYLLADHYKKVGRQQSGNPFQLSSLIEKHLVKAFEGNANDYLVQQELAALHLARASSVSNQLERRPALLKAAQSFETLVEKDIAFALPLAEIYLELEEKERLNNLTDIAIEGVKPKLEDPNTKIGALVFVSRFLILSKKHQAASELLLDHSQRSQGEQRRRIESILSELYVSWSDLHRPDQESPDSQRQLELIYQALRFNPLSEAATLRMIQFNQDPKAFSDEQLNKMLLESNSPHLINLSLAERAMKANDNERALEHYRRAMEQAPAVAPGMLNNMAWVIAKDRNGDFPLALQLINQCLEMLKGRPDYRTALDTRGRIYIRLGEFEKALADLELALTDDRLQNNLGVLNSLSICYEKLGNTKQAKAARDRIAAIRVAEEAAKTQAENQIQSTPK